MGNEELRHLIVQLRSAVKAGAPLPATLELIDRIESAVGRVCSEADGMRARLQRPLTPHSSSCEETAKLEAWVRRLERPETTAQ